MFVNKQEQESDDSTRVCIAVSVCCQQRYILIHIVNYSLANETIEFTIFSQLNFPTIKSFSNYTN